MSIGSSRLGAFRARSRALLVLACLVGWSGCRGAPSVRLELGDTRTIGSPGGEEPNLHVATDGSVLLTWFEPEERGARLALALKSGAEWSAPVTVADERDFFVNWADFPSAIRTSEGRWVVHWLERVAGRSPYAYHVRLSVSEDRGASWSEPVTPHGDSSATEHGFVSMVPMEDGATALTWLDGRQTPEGAAEGEGDMSLRFTTLDRSGALGPEVLLDDRTCECCQTAMVRTTSGLLAAYRDRSPTEVRNIAVVRRTGSTWSAPAQIHDDGWVYPGCPVNGPALDADGDSVAAAWFTAPGQEPRVNVAFSEDGGVSFSEPVRVDAGSPSGRVDVNWLEPGLALVTWIEPAGDGEAEVLARVVGPGLVPGPAVSVGLTGASRASGFPKVVRSGRELIFAWHDSREGSAGGGVRVRTGTWTGR